MKVRIIAAILIIISVAIGYWTWKPSTPWKLGLDLNGGTHLAYRADTSKVVGDASEVMDALRETIERRINLFGVSEPIVQAEKAGGEHRLIVELPGVTDIEDAVAQIGKTPLLEFKVLKKDADISNATSSEQIAKAFTDTGLTGQYLKRSQVQFDPSTQEPMVSLEFNDEGTKLFADITKANVGNVVAIFLDGEPISIPVVRQEIRDGKAQISGNFRLDEARDLVKNLNYGALPVPIELISTETVGPTLGKAVLDAGVRAGFVSFIVVSLFLVLWYRVPGLVAVVALAMYVIFNLALFKFIPVTLTAAGIAGFILSIGMAVDANILIFERTKEELRKGKKLQEAIHEGFARAWLSIRDSNSSSIITALILYYFASTPVIKGFALVFLIGVLVSMFTAITATRAMLYALPQSEKNWWKALFKSGIIK